MDEMLRTCLVMNTIMAARALARRADAEFRPFGVSVVQFSMLMVLNARSGEPVSRMAERLSMDRTTLIRNLELLVKKGLVSAQPTAKGPGRDFLLTEEGKALAARLIEAWPDAQRRMRARLPEDEPERFLATLKALSAE
jgi:DNA-binding MarR family transcriptional regulator